MNNMKQSSFKKNLYIKFAVIFLIFCIFIFFSVSANKRKNTYNFDAKIIEIQNNSFLIQKIDENTEMRVYVNQPYDNLLIGDLVNIEYDGTINEAYPPIITALNIKKIPISK